MLSSIGQWKVIVLKNFLLQAMHPKKKGLWEKRDT
jgi:hypothetical protein